MPPLSVLYDGKLDVLGVCVPAFGCPFAPEQLNPDIKQVAVVSPLLKHLGFPASNANINPFVTIFGPL